MSFIRCRTTMRRPVETPAVAESAKHVAPADAPSRHYADIVSTDARCLLPPTVFAISGYRYSLLPPPTRTTTLFAEPTPDTMKSTRFCRQQQFPYAVDEAAALPYWRYFAAMPDAREQSADAFAEHPFVLPLTFHVNERLLLDICHVQLPAQHVFATATTA